MAIAGTRVSTMERPCFGSPRRLNLQLCWSTKTPATETLNVWPVLPILVVGNVSEGLVDNVIAELEHSDRISQINLFCRTTLHIEKLWTAMEVSFPELTVLVLSFEGLPCGPDLPDSFLGGSPSRLQSLALISIPFPGLPKLLLTCPSPRPSLASKYPSFRLLFTRSDAICLSVLTSLESFYFEFHSPQSSPDQETRRLPPPTRSVLPALEIFSFKGVNEYLEELPRIDTPRLDHLSTMFFNDIDFDIPELIQFITLTFEALEDVHVVFGGRTAWVTLQRRASFFADVTVEISCSAPDWQLSALAQICTSFLPLLSDTENLYIREHVQTGWKGGIENTEWLELLLPFTAMKNLYLSKQFAPRLASALQEGGTTEVLSTLQNLYLEGYQSSESVQEGIAQFISARQLTNRPVAISTWERQPEKERKLVVYS